MKAWPDSPHQGLRRQEADGGCLSCGLRREESGGSRCFTTIWQDTGVWVLILVDQMDTQKWLRLEPRGLHARQRGSWWEEQMGEEGGVTERGRGRERS